MDNAMKTASHTFRLLIAATLALATVPIAKALDFKATRSFRMLEGVKIPLLLFPDGTREIRYEPPDRWEIAGEGATISFRPKGLAMAELKLILSPKAPARAGERAGQVPAPGEVLNAHLPPDATKVEPVSEAENPFMLENAGSHEAVLAFTSGGQRYRISIATCDLNPTQWLAVVTTAFERDFEEVRRAAIGSMFSWQAL